jgi:hypothetical protein
VLTVLASRGGQEWLGADEWNQKPVQLWLMANGLLYLALGLGHARSPTGLARFWGELFMLLVPVSLLVPTNVLFDDPPFFGQAGGQGISLFEYATILLSITLVLFGTKTRRTTFIAPGIFGLALAVLRLTDRHFEELLAWPLALALLGGAAMVVGAVLTFARSRKKKVPERAA